MLYGYLSAIHEEPHAAKSAIESFASKSGLDITDIIEDTEHNKTHWEKRQISFLLNQKCEAGDAIIVYEASDLARSTLQVLEILDVLASKELSLYIVRYEEKFAAGKFYDTESFLQLMKHIEGEFVTKRTTDALARRRAAGLPLGRPKGRRNKSRKLDKHRAEIKKYLALNINKASIAKLVGCHAQTLYNYLEDTNLAEEVAAEGPASPEEVAAAQAEAKRAATSDE